MNFCNLNKVNMRDPSTLFDNLPIFFHRFALQIKLLDQPSPQVPNLQSSCLTPLDFLQCLALHSYQHHIHWGPGIHLRYILCVVCCRTVFHVPRLTLHTILQYQHPTTKPKITRPVRSCGTDINPYFLIISASIREYVSSQRKPFATHTSPPSTCSCSFPVCSLTASDYPPH